MSKKTMVYLAILSVMLMTFTTATFAQEDEGDEACPVLVEEAIAATDTLCTDIARNEACYGNVQLIAESQPEVTEFTFDNPGDIEAITDILSLSLSAMSAPDEWGVALLRVQASLPDTAPGQNVTMLLFGDVRIENRGQVAPPTITITANTNINVRSGPGTNNRAVDVFDANTEAIADGRNAAGDWIRIILEDESTGWVFADLVTVEEDASVDSLNVTDETRAASGAIFGPMQAFYFTTGVGLPQCQEAPQDGILLQTPGGVGRVDLLINEVTVRVGSTAFLRNVEDDGMYVTVLDGEVWANAFEQTTIAPAGSMIRVPVDSNGIASGAPELLPLDKTMITSLPLSLLPEEITVPVPLGEVELEEARVLSRTPFSGTWRLDEASCGEEIGTDVPIEFSVDGSEMTMVWFGETLNFNFVEGSTYTDGVRDLFVLSPESISSVNTENRCSIALSLRSGADS
ncbi:MAG: SH3 domain-containing protein [Chloroflexota bacterium]